MCRQYGHIDIRARICFLIYNLESTDDMTIIIDIILFAILILVIIITKHCVCASFYFKLLIG